MNEDLLRDLCARTLNVDAPRKTAPSIHQLVARISPTYKHTATVCDWHRGCSDVSSCHDDDTTQTAQTSLCLPVPLFTESAGTLSPVSLCSRNRPPFDRAYPGLIMQLRIAGLQQLFKEQRPRPQPLRIFEESKGPPGDRQDLRVPLRSAHVAANASRLLYAMAPCRSTP